MKVLKKTFNSIREIKPLSGLNIEKILLSSPFSIVRLNDASIGSAINYDNLLNPKTGYQIKLREEKFYSEVQDDPLLWNTLVGEKDLLSTSLKVSILSALSQNLFTGDLLSKFGIRLERTNYSNEFDGDFQYSVRSIVGEPKNTLIIGEGGIYPYYVLKMNIPKVTVCDIKYRDIHQLRKSEREADLLIRKFGFDGDLSFIDVQEIDHIEKSVDVLWITGSVLCNNTFRELVPLFGKAKKVVLQGPSCSIFPEHILQSGVTDILTTIKSERELELGQFKSTRIYDIVDKNYIHMKRV